MVLTTANGKLITGDPDRNPRLLVREALQILSTLVAGHLESHDVTDDVFAEGLRGAVHALGAPPG